MATPAAIAVYLESGPAPARVADRPWRGTYNHYDGDPGSLGNHLLARVARAEGDVARVVAEVIDAAPHGWTSLEGNEPEPEHSPGPPVGPTDTNQIAFVYVFDVAARRLDVFETYEEGQRLVSAEFDATGAPSVRALDLDPTEDVIEPPLPGPRLDAGALQALLAELPALGNGTSSLEWGPVTEADDGALIVGFRDLDFEDGALQNVMEREAPLVPSAARDEPQRVRNFFTALAVVLGERLTTASGHHLTSALALARTEARSAAAFEAILRSPRYFGGDDDQD